ncbi:MAG: polysaccharide deacetylase family protein [Gemmatimonadaceae bacterium]|nr:polysaccharide deacetylase family protein [Gemmatimonadaceae bacterium]
MVCYHGVSTCSRAGRHWLLLPRREFERQVRYLSSNYCLLPIDAALSALYEGKLTEPTASITFDDGYRNNFEEAFPVLTDRQAPATIFLATGFIGTARRLWTTELELLFEQAGPVSVDLRSLGLGRVTLGDADRVRPVALAVNRAAKRLSPADRAATISGIRQQVGSAVADSADSFAFMGWDDVRRMETSGLITFGAHTVNHEIVGRVDAEARHREIQDSVARVDTELSGDHRAGVSRVFAYPNGAVGDFSDACAEELRAARCTAALTTVQGLASSTHAPFEVRRVVVSGDMRFSEFCARTSGLVGND